LKEKIGKLNNKVAVVTGGNRGIGKAISLTLANEGATVVILARDKKTSSDVVRRIKRNREALFLKTDVTIENDINAAIEETIRKFKRIDILVNNVGGIIFNNKASRTSIKDISKDEWEAIIKLNLTSTFFCTKAVIPIMQKQRSGKIINISSNNGKVGQATISHYSAAKAGIIAFTQSAARELSEFGIRVNAIAPGRIMTDALSEQPESYREKWIKETLVGRLGDPEEIARVALFLASDDSSYVVGETINANGGIILD
jgi:NAD(P)-dependent dehydrogenase (short-subunit alcohol dehydrogenase family)